MLTAQLASPSLSRWLGFPDLSRLPKPISRRVVKDQSEVIDPPAKPTSAANTARAAQLKEIRSSRCDQLGNEETLSSIAVKIYGNQKATNQAGKLIRALMRDGLMAIKHGKRSGRSQIYVKVKHD